jgi:hypothetical protein
MPPPSASISVAPLPAEDLRFAPAHEPVIRRIWSSAIITFGLGLSVVWTCLLGYGLVRLFEFAF